MPVAGPRNVAEPAEATSLIAARVVNARNFAKQDEGASNGLADGDNPAASLDRNFSSAAITLMKSAMAKRQLSARGFHKIMKVARTIANLAGAHQIQRDHVAEALAYRMMPLLA